MYTASDIQQIVDTINKHYSLLMFTTLGSEAMSEQDKLFLMSQGVDIDTIKLQFPEYSQMFLLGRLTALLKEQQAAQLTQEDFQKYLERGQFVPLSPREQAEYEYSRAKTYNHLKGLANRIEGATRDILLEDNKKQIISEEISTGVKDRLSVKSVVSNIGHRTEEWSRDWERIVRTEMQDIYNQGRTSEIIEKHGVDVEVWKQTYEGACRHCIRLHLTNGLGSKPIVFKLSELIKNGTNIGLRVADWKAVIGPTHPYCRCDIRHADPAKRWDDELKQWVFKEIERKVIRTSKIKMMVGDKEFLI